MPVSSAVQVTTEMQEFLYLYCLQRTSQLNSKFHGSLFMTRSLCKTYPPCYSIPQTALSHSRHRRFCSKTSRLSEVNLMHHRTLAA